MLVGDAMTMFERGWNGGSQVVHLQGLKLDKLYLLGPEFVQKGSPRLVAYPNTIVTVSAYFAF